VHEISPKLQCNVNFYMQPPARSPTNQHFTTRALHFADDGYEVCVNSVRVNIHRPCLRLQAGDGVGCVKPRIECPSRYSPTDLSSSFIRDIRELLTTQAEMHPSYK
jgi:hypothetical protein